MNNLVDEYNDSYQRSIGRKYIDANYSVFTEETETSRKAPKSKVGDIV